MKFFDGETASKFTQDAIEFCKEFERQRRATVEFVEMMDKASLFEQKSVAFTPRDAQGNAGETQKIADYWAISEEGLNALPESKFQDIRNTGALAAVYAHMVSLMNWQRVIQRTMRRLAASRPHGQLPQRFVNVTGPSLTLRRGGWTCRIRPPQSQGLREPLWPAWQRVQMNRGLRVRLTCPCSRRRSGWPALALCARCAWRCPAGVSPGDRQSDHAEGTLLLERSAATPGDSFLGALQLKLADGWHVYWAIPATAACRRRRRGRHRRR